MPAKKEIVIVGIGSGMETLTREAYNMLCGAEVWFGAGRVLALLQEAHDNTKQILQFYKSEDIKSAAENSAAKKFAVAVSGDPGFYSAAENIINAFSECEDYNVSVIPGVSSLNMFYARLKRPYSGAALMSAHGRANAQALIVSLVRRNREVFCLAGANADKLGAALCDAGFEGLKVYTGENLGGREEKITTMSAAELSRTRLSSLTVLLIENPAPDSRQLSGLPDESFIRGDGIAMTKSIIRAAVLSRLALKEDDVVYDIGAGTGSVSVELALAAWRGSVYSIEKNPDAAGLIEKNKRRFHIGNIGIIRGGAPAALESLPPPDAAFIGGSGGELAEIIQTTRNKNPRVRIAAASVTVENTARLLELMPAADVVQVSAAEGKSVNGLHILRAQNPVCIVTDGGLNGVHNVR